MSLALLLTVAGLGAQEPLAFAPEIRPVDPVVRLADVVDLSLLPEPLRERAAGLAVARLAGDERILSSQRMARRARAALPGLTPWLPEGADRPVRVISPAPEAAPMAEAVRVEAGDPVVVRASVGPVIVEREARALQTGRPGRKVFVRTADGAVLSVRLEAPR